jgi:hypothetical protein
MFSQGQKEEKGRGYGPIICLRRFKSHSPNTNHPPLPPHPINQIENKCRRRTLNLMPFSLAFFWNCCCCRAVESYSFTAHS